MESLTSLFTNLLISLCTNLTKLISQIPNSHIYLTYSPRFLLTRYIHLTLFNQLNQQNTNTIFSIYTPSNITKISSFIHPTTLDIENSILLLNLHNHLTLTNKVSPLLAKYFYKIIYTSFVKAHVPSILTHALVIPILEKKTIYKKNR